MSAYSNRKHIVRAVLEASAYQTREILDAMIADSGVELTELKVDGGSLITLIFILMITLIFTLMITLITWYLLLWDNPDNPNHPDNRDNRDVFTCDVLTPSGMTANNFLMQFQADVLHIPVQKAALAEATAGLWMNPNNHDNPLITLW